MKTIKYLMLVFALICIDLNISAKQADVYMFGISCSFNDSIVYLTNIQEVKGAYIEDRREHFLVNRNDYSSQLKNFFANRGQANRTCVIIWASTQKDIEKKYQKLKDKFIKKNKYHYEIRFVRDEEFLFKAVSPEEGSVFVNPEEAEKAAMESNKKKQKEHKQETE